MFKKKTLHEGNRVGLRVEIRNGAFSQAKLKGYPETRFQNVQTFSAELKGVLQVTFHKQRLQARHWEALRSGGPTRARSSRILDKDKESDIMMPIFLAVGAWHCAGNGAVVLALASSTLWPMLILKSWTAWRWTGLFRARLLLLQRALHHLRVQLRRLLQLLRQRLGSLHSAHTERAARREVGGGEAGPRRARADARCAHL